MKNLIILFLLLSFTFNSFSKEKRDILQKEAKEIGIGNVLVKNFDDLNFPTYYSRKFWDGLPEAVKKQYIGHQQLLDIFAIMHTH